MAANNSDTKPKTKTESKTESKTETKIEAKEETKTHSQTQRKQAWIELEMALGYDQTKSYNEQTYVSTVCIIFRFILNF